GGGAVHREGDGLGRDDSRELGSDGGRDGHRLSEHGGAAGRGGEAEAGGGLDDRLGGRAGGGARVGVGCAVVGLRTPGLGQRQDRRRQQGEVEGRRAGGRIDQHGPGGVVHGEGHGAGGDDRRPGFARDGGGEHHVLPVDRRVHRAGNAHADVGLQVRQHHVVG